MIVCVNTFCYDVIDGSIRHGHTSKSEGYLQFTFRAELVDSMSVTLSII